MLAVVECWNHESYPFRYEVYWRTPYNGGDLKDEEIEKATVVRKGARGFAVKPFGWHVWLPVDLSNEAEPFRFQEVKIPPPIQNVDYRQTQPVRYQNGRYERYLQTRGWVPIDGRRYSKSDPEIKDLHRADLNGQQGYCFFNAGLKYWVPKERKEELKSVRRVISKKGKPLQNVKISCWVEGRADKDYWHSLERWLLKYAILLT